MARLAAYYQEDFHYSPVSYGTKQKKSAYVFYDPQRNNVLHNNYINGGPRLRALASSEPSLFPTYTYAPKTAVMTLKARPRPLNNKLIEQSRMAVQRLERIYEPTQCSNPYAVGRLEADTFDCESVYSQGGKSMYDETYVKRKHKSKDKLSKRLPYDFSNNYQKPTELCAVQNLDRYHTSPVHIQCVDTMNGESFPLEEPYSSNCEDCILPPASFRSDSSHGRWQQWPWNDVDPRSSPAMLSPPSPLDSGLSSQSITSSPSLDAEPVPGHPGQMQIIRPDSHHICSCSQVYTESNRIISSPSRYDSGSSSPGAYTATRKSKRSARIKDRQHANNGVVYLENDFEEDYTRGQIRYGRLGLVGESIPQYSTLVKVPNGSCHNSECVQNSINNNSNIPSVYYYAKDNTMTIKKCDSCPSKHYESQTNYMRPSVIITEASDKSNHSSLDSTLSPDQENSEKSPEPESSMSTEVSNSTTKSSSDASTSKELENENRRKSKKKTEKEIRELEDMYKKCNLSDTDLLERAERRDLPTVHQTKLDQSPPTLTRSKSDTFFEMFSSTYCNPYESPQRAPPFRRSGIPDIIGDDMALRKNRKPVTTSTFNPTENTMTYMLCSSHFTPTVPNGKDILLMDNPDIEYDDLSYRKHYFGKKSKIPDPQPPFGIPLRPPPPQSVYNDYLHIVPTSGPKPLCHPRGNPDVVRDDMAFRTLRKDEPERLYFDSMETYRKKKY